MLVNPKTLDKIKDLMKVNIYEAKVYTALLSRGISSASELADISGVPRSRCYDVLECLEKKGFVFQKIGKPIKYIAIAPEEVLETIKKQADNEKNRMLSLYESIKTAGIYEELQQLYNTGINYVDGGEISHSITGRQNINLFLKDMLAKATKNVTIHTTKEGLKRKMKLLKKSVSKDVKVTIHSPEDKPMIREKNITLNKAESGLRLINIDNNELLIFTSPEEIDPEQESAIWLKSRFTSDMIRNFLI